MRMMADLRDQGYRIHRFTSDGGGEFVNTELKTFIEARGIQFVPTHPHTPKESDVVEKLDGVLVNKMRAVINDANLT